MQGKLSRFESKKRRLAGLPSLSGHEALRPHFKYNNPIVPGVLEVITQGVYDYYEVAAGNAVTSQILFTIPIGGSYTPAGGSAFQKTIYHTFLEQQGQLQAPQKLLVKGLSLYIRQDVAISDLNSFTGNCQVTFNVSGKDYLNIVAAKLPAGGGTFGSGSIFQTTAANAAYTSVGNGYPQADAIYQLEGDGVQIEQQQAFKVTLNPTLVQAGAFTTAAAAGTTFGTGIKVIFTLEGLLSRAVV